jgi:NADH dehydrogenase FAD-containing subunit
VKLLLGLAEEPGYDSGLLAEATDFDVPNGQVVLNDGTIGYDTLVVATGSRLHYFGDEHWEALAPSLGQLKMRPRSAGAFFSPLKLLSAKLIQASQARF